jgi:hypothetical protein
MVCPESGAKYYPVGKTFSQIYFNHQQVTSGVPFKRTSRKVEGDCHSAKWETDKLICQ